MAKLTIIIGTGKTISQYTASSGKSPRQRYTCCESLWLSYNTMYINLLHALTHDRGLQTNVCL